jgi:uncharacterized protein
MQRPRKVPLRKCVGCQEQSPKRDLIRIVLTPEGETCLDLTGKQNGRGAYLCKKVECFQQARKRKSLERALKSQIPEAVYEALQMRLQGALANEPS